MMGSWSAVVLNPNKYIKGPLSPTISNYFFPTYTQDLTIDIMVSTLFFFLSLLVYPPLMWYVTHRENNKPDWAENPSRTPKEVKSCM